MAFIQNLNCNKWQFNNIHEFTYGKMSAVFADCGKNVNYGGSSFMHSFFGVKDFEIAEYADKLKEKFELCYENNIDGNLFYQYKTAGDLFYVSYLKATETARFILEENCGCAVCDFGYEASENKYNNTLFSQYSLYYDAMNKGTTCDCGMNYIFRLRDGSLIIIDGGEKEQATDVAIADYWELLKEITDKKENEKIRISLWICTHAHDDHADFFAKLLRTHNEEITVERVAFNFPLETNIAHSPTIPTALERIVKNNTNVKYLKVHSGMKFNICNATLEFYGSAEEAVDVYEGVVFPGLNDTSLSFSVTAENKKALFLADMGERNGRIFIENFKNAVSDTVFLQAAHHGINGIFDVYKNLHTKYLLLPQCNMNMETRFPENYENFFNLYGKENVLLAHNKTDIFVLENGNIERSTREHIGGKWDESEF